MTDDAGASPDARVRFEQGVFTLALLTGFVFRVPWVLPGVALLVALGLAPGVAIHPLRWAYDRVIAPRVRLASPSPAAPTLDRRDDFAALVVLSVASLALVAGIDVVAWLAALLQAAASAVRATTGVPVAATLTERFGRGR